MSRTIKSNRVMIVVLCAILMQAALVRAQLPGPQEVLDNWAHAIGGRELIDGIDRLESNGDLKMFGMDGTFKQKLSQPDRFVMVMDVGGIFKHTQLAHGGRVWMKDQNGHVAEIVGKQQADLLTSLFFESMKHLRSGASASLVTSIDVEEKTGYLRVTIAPPACNATVYFLDRSTWLPVRSESDGGGGLTLVTHIVAWERFQDVMFPQQLNLTSGDPRGDITISLTSIFLNPIWTDDPFRPLAEVETPPVVLNPQLASSIPVTLRDSHVYVDIMVNGQGPFQFIYDTGAAITVIDKGLAESLALEMHGKLAAGGAGKNAAELNLTSGVNFAMPGIEVRNQTIAVLDIENLLEERVGTRIDGILGFGFISRFVTEIDHAGSRIGFHDPETFRYEGPGVVVPLTIDNSEPHIQATVRGYGAKPVTGTFLLDTGFSGAVSLTGPFEQKNNILETMPRIVERKGGFGVGGEASSKFGRLQSLEVGGLVFEEPAISVSLDEAGVGAGESIAGLIGCRIMARCRTFFDYAGNRLILEPNGSFADHFRWDKSGLTLITGGRGDLHRFLILRVVEDSPGQKAGLLAGDQLVEINGRPATAWTADALREFFSGDEKDVEIVRQRKGRTKLVTLKLREMF